MEGMINEFLMVASVVGGSLFLLIMILISYVLVKIRLLLGMNISGEVL